MYIEANEIHIWMVRLLATAEQVKEHTKELSQDELERAKRFHLPIHSKRFILARSILRKIISRYLHTPPQAITFSYTKYKKPYLNPQLTNLHFNLAHSNDIAIYAFTNNYLVGVDIEKMQTTFDPNVAKRYYSESENAALLQLDEADKVTTFYRIWARKEALIKATGKGLNIPLHSFSVATRDASETITLEGKNWSLIPISVNAEYQAALASNQSINKLSYWNIFDHNFC